jgi:hypothetical protein
MRKFIVERDVPAIGKAERQELKAVAGSFNAALRQPGSEIQWVESYVADDKTFCVFFAPDEHTIRHHAERSGFPIDKITEIMTVIDPTTTLSRDSSSPD